MTPLGMVVFVSDDDIIRFVVVAVVLTVFARLVLYPLIRGDRGR